MTMLSNNRFAHYIGCLLSHLLPPSDACLPVGRGEGKDGGGHLGPPPHLNPPPPRGEEPIFGSIGVEDPRNGGKGEG